MGEWETLAQFRERTRFVWQRPCGEMIIPADQADKVAADGTLKTYLGDTVIFDLDEDVRAEIARMQRALYAICAPHGCLAEKLPPDSFHITLHDLVSGPAQKREEVLCGMQARERAVNQILAEAEFEPIRMRAMTMMSMVNRSAVLCFEPVGEADCAVLMALYERLQNVVRLGHKLTPHVTLAYFRPDAPPAGDGSWRGTVYGGEAADALRRAFESVAFEGGYVYLRRESLRYCCFADMSRYVGREEMLKAIGRNR